MRTRYSILTTAFFTAICLLSSVESVLADSISTQSPANPATSRSESSSEASFNGNDGRHVVNGDVVEVKRGRLSVNGVPYGTVNPESMIRYSIRGSQKTLVVDGKVRPLRK